MPSADQPQLDLFADSGDVMLRNDAIDALLRRDAAAAERARLELMAFDAMHPSLPALQLLITTLTAPPGVAFHTHAQVQQERQHVLQNISPAAQHLLTDQTSTWLAPLWRDLAQRAAALPFVADQADVHASALWWLAGDGAAAVQAVDGIASWRRIPAPLATMVMARHKTQGLDATWPLLVELGWLAPVRLRAAVQHLGDPLLLRLLQRFDAEFEPDDEPDEPPGEEDPTAWLAAWLVNDKPALLPHLRLAEPGLNKRPERAMRLMCELLGLEHQGRRAELIAHRKRLLGLAPALYATYMHTR
jgi:hypothetical protein